MELYKVQIKECCACGKPTSKRGMPFIRYGKVWHRECWRTEVVEWDKYKLLTLYKEASQ